MNGLEGGMLNVVVLGGWYAIETSQILEQATDPGVEYTSSREEVEAGRLLSAREAHPSHACELCGENLAKLSGLVQGCTRVGVQVYLGPGPEQDKQWFDWLQEPEVR
ncbi:hypothetical protein AB0C89_09630 [Streptomyces sp. NPDC048491]|uniref:hypothetical protein n=1 Tax=Streptomyces sp. NPDC048491 TaxID=3157207 RepID=UPI00342077FB